jgi:beta-lactamase regulating signal transducer with metallopeptidase domain
MLSSSVFGSRRLRSRMATLLLAAWLALACLSAPALGAGIGAGGFQKELTEGSPETETTTTATTATTATTEEGSTKSSGSTITIVLVIGVALLAGVAFVIVRDARRVAPAGEAEVAEGSSARHTEAAMRKRRAKAKAARAQRKRNR